MLVQIATVLNAKIKQDGLSDIGNLEQDFVYGDATIKELINILNNNQVQTPRFSSADSYRCSKCAGMNIIDPVGVVHKWWAMSPLQ